MTLLLVLCQACRLFIRPRAIATSAWHVKLIFMYCKSHFHSYCRKCLDTEFLFSSGVTKLQLVHIIFCRFFANMVNLVAAAKLSSSWVYVIIGKAPEVYHTNGLRAAPHYKLRWVSDFLKKNLTTSSLTHFHTMFYFLFNVLRTFIKLGLALYS